VRGPIAASAAAWIDAVIGLRDVDRDRHPAGLRNGFERCDKRKRGHDDFVTGLESSRDQRKTKRVKSARKADAIFRTQSAAKAFSNSGT
jgi:hypothetical protein